MTSMPLVAVAGSTNYTAITISVGIIFVIGATIAIAVASYFRHRKLAEDAVANQQELRSQMEKLTESVRAVEKLMRDVG